MKNNNISEMSIEDVIKKIFPDVSIITKDRGNRGYYIRYNCANSYSFLSIKEIINYLSYNRYGMDLNDRMRKLLTLRIKNEYNEKQL